MATTYKTGQKPNKATVGKPALTPKQLDARKRRNIQASRQSYEEAMQRKGKGGALNRGAGSGFAGSSLSRPGGSGLSSSPPSSPSRPSLPF